MLSLLREQRLGGFHGLGLKLLAHHEVFGVELLRVVGELHLGLRLILNGSVAELRFSSVVFPSDFRIGFHLLDLNLRLRLGHLGAHIRLGLLLRLGHVLFQSLADLLQIVELLRGLRDEFLVHRGLPVHGRDLSHQLEMLLSVLHARSDEVDQLRGPVEFLRIDPLLHHRLRGLRSLAEQREVSFDVLRLIIPRPRGGNLTFLDKEIIGVDIRVIRDGLWRVFDERLHILVAPRGGDLRFAGVELSHPRRGHGECHIGLHHVKTHVSGAAVAVPAMFVAAEIAGLRVALYPQQGLTNTEITTWTSVPNMFLRFSPEDLDDIAAAGTFIVEGGTVYVRHQLTTETEKGSLQYEDSVGTNLDFISFEIKDIVRGYIGKRNVNPQTLDELNRKISLYLDKKVLTSPTPEIGSAIIDYADLVVKVDDIQKDKINISVDLTFALPLNHIVVTLRASTLV